MTSHALHPAKQFARDTHQVVTDVLVSLWRHVFGIVVVIVALAFTAGVMLGFIALGWHFAAIMTGLIGLLGIAIGISYHAIGE